MESNGVQMRGTESGVKSVKWVQGMSMAGECGRVSM